MILCIETATTNCSVALGKKGKVLALKEDYSSSYSHAERLHLFIEQILQENDLKPQDLSAIAVSKGPGSYTGLRIGVSAAKGLCFALDLPLISIPTLRALALQVKQEKDGFIIPLLDARRMEVYTAGFSADRKQILDTQAKILDELVAVVYAGVVTFVIGALLKAVMGWRVTPEDEEMGIDQAQHAEIAYEFVLGLGFTQFALQGLDAGARRQALDGLRPAGSSAFSRRTCSRRFSTSACTEASSAEVGSSSSRIDGSRISARAIATRWRWPPDN